MELVIARVGAKRRLFGQSNFKSIQRDCFTSFAMTGHIGSLRGVENDEAICRYTERLLRYARNDRRYKGVL